MLKGNYKKNEPPEIPPAPPGPSSSTLARSLHLKGEISGTDDLTVHGQIQGKIELEGRTLTVMPGGRVKAEIRVKDISIRGSVEGSIQATGTARIEREGRMNGDVAAASISIAEGAFFKGNIKVLPGR